MPDQSGRVYLVTGGNTGLGYEICKALAAKRAHVFMASRNPSKQERAVETIRRELPGAQIDWLECDLGNLRSVAECAEEFKRRKLPLHGLCSNAGVIDPPDDRTPEGFEVTLGINYFGAVLLIQLLLDTLQQQKASRLCLVNSISEVHGTVDWADLTGARPQRSDYDKYARSKVYLSMFGRELQKRLRANGSDIDCFHAHPGISATDIFRKEDKSKPTANVLNTLGNGILARWQPPSRAAHSMLYTLTEPSLTGTGDGLRTYGPTYLGLPIKPLALCLNLQNIDYRKLQNKWVYDEAACSKLYDETVNILNQHSPTKIKGLSLQGQRVAA